MFAKFFYLYVVHKCLVGIFEFERFSVFECHDCTNILVSNYGKIMSKYFKRKLFSVPFLRIKSNIQVFSNLRGVKKIIKILIDSPCDVPVCLWPSG